MKAIVRFIFTIYGGLMIGIIFHEAYHTQTIKQVTQICYENGTDALFAVYGFGGSVNEMVAYGITGLILVMVLAFAIYDLFTTEV